jgi:cytidylate kinase
MVARDHADSTRADSPLTDDGTYLRVDTSALTADEVVARLLEAVEKG